MSGTAVRLLIKLSGEALAGPAPSAQSDGPEPFGIDPLTVRRFAEEVADARAAGAEIALVLGGGNLFRGAALADAGLGRVTGDHMGMLATVMNALAFRDVLQSVGVTASVLSAVAIQGIVDGYAQQRAMSLLAEGHVVLFAAGTGNPFFTTDSAACLRGIEIGADLVLKATKVDGVYSADPLVEPGAQRFEHLGYDEVISRDLKVMDLTAICLCRDHQMPLRVLDVNSPGVLARVARGEAVGTLIDAGTVT